jgi:hypothetical protein
MLTATALHPYLDHLFNVVGDHHACSLAVDRVHMSGAYCD